MERDQDAVDTVLAALTKVPTPEGIEARIMQHLVGREGQVPLAARHAATQAWWRGALSGAAAALLIGGFVLLAGREFRPHRDAARQDANVGLLRPAVAPGALAVRAAVPCVAPGATVLRAAAPRAPLVMPQRGSGLSSVVSSRRSFPSSEPPLTAEERQLLRLARRGYPADDPTPDPLLLAELKAENAANFDNFLTQSVTGDSTWNRLTATRPDGL